MKKRASVRSLKPLVTVMVVAAVYIGLYLLMSQDILSRGVQSMMIKMCYNIILAVSLNLVVGVLGELSLGHAGFYAIGAYTGCMVAIHTDFPMEARFLLALLVGGVSAALGGFLIGSSILRLRGDYLAIVTLAFGEIIRALIKILPGTGGTSGLTGIPSFANKPQAFAWSFAVVLLTLLLIRNFTRSRHGRAVTAIRDNAIAAQSIGITVNRYKVMVFVIAAFFAGLAGVIFGFYKNILEPSDFDYNVSIEILVMVVLGGMGSLTGAVIAACVITALPEVLRDANQYRLLIYALALILMMVLNASPRFAAFKKKIHPRRLIDRLRKKSTGEEGVSDVAP